MAYRTLLYSATPLPSSTIKKLKKIATSNNSEFQISKPEPDSFLAQIPILFRENYTQYPIKSMLNPELIIYSMFKKPLYVILIMDDSEVIATGSVLRRINALSNNVFEIGRTALKPNRHGRGLGRFLTELRLALIDSILNTEKPIKPLIYAEPRALDPANQHNLFNAGLIPLAMQPKYLVGEYREYVFRSFLNPRGSLFLPSIRDNRPLALPNVVRIRPSREVRPTPQSLFISSQNVFAVTNRPIKVGDLYINLYLGHAILTLDFARYHYTEQQLEDLLREVESIVSAVPQSSMFLSLDFIFEFRSFSAAQQHFTPVLGDYELTGYVPACSENGRFILSHGRLLGDSNCCDIILAATLPSDLREYLESKKTFFG